MTDEAETYRSQDYIEGWYAGLYKSKRDLRRSQSAALWQSWGALAAMFIADGIATRRGAVLESFVLDDAARAVRRSEAHRTWQSITGVLVFAAYVTQAREEAHASGAAEGYADGHSNGSHDGGDQESMDRGLMD